LSLNYDKMHLLQFVTKTNQEIDMQISLNKKNHNHSMYKISRTDYWCFPDLEVSY
jgi:hypothetical protein